MDRLFAFSSEGPTKHKTLGSRVAPPHFLVGLVLGEAYFFSGEFWLKALVESPITHHDVSSLILLQYLVVS